MLWSYLVVTPVDSVTALVHFYCPLCHFDSFQRTMSREDKDEPAENDLQELATKLSQAGALDSIIEDRRYHLKTYKQCFIGKEAVDFLVNEGHALTRDDAVALGRALQQSYLFEHVTRDQ